VLDNYPTSPVASSAQYQIGYAWMHASKAGDYDMDAAKKAVDAFQDYLVRYPDSDKSEQAQENIQHLGQTQTQGAYDIAKFYETQKTPEDKRAAYIYYNEVVREDPNSAQAQLAKKRILALRPAVEAMPGGAGVAGITDSPTAGQTLPNGTQVPTPPNTAPMDGSSVPAQTDASSAGTPGGTPTPASSVPPQPPVSSPPDPTPLPQ